MRYALRCVNIYTYSATLIIVHRSSYKTFISLHLTVTFSFSETFCFPIPNCHGENKENQLRRKFDVMHWFNYYYYYQPKKKKSKKMMVHSGNRPRYYHLLYWKCFFFVVVEQRKRIQCCNRLKAGCKMRCPNPVMEFNILNVLLLLLLEIRSFRSLRLCCLWRQNKRIRNTSC